MQGPAIKRLSDPASACTLASRQASLAAGPAWSQAGGMTSAQCDSFSVGAPRLQPNWLGAMHLKHAAPQLQPT